MIFRHIIPTLALILACAASSLAGPARNGDIYLRQPDGSVFKARLRGDEFTRIRTDASGHAIIQDKDGWWNYAIYGKGGVRTSSGHRVGKEVPYETLDASARIPYGELSQMAQKARNSAFSTGRIPILRRMKTHEGLLTKSESEAGPAVKHGLVILASFKDVQFKHTREEFESLLVEEGYSVNGATGSAKEYFDAQFNGLLEFDFHVTDIVTLSRNREYYGGNNDNGNDKAPAEMIAEACRLADDQIDFSLYDDDLDGEADNVFVFFAGQDEAEGASEECIWSHAWYIRSGAGIKLELDGTIIDRYACSSELTIAFDAEGKVYEYINGIGTFCHEYSHTMGLPDFYDTDYEESGGIAAGLWISTSLMDGGNYNNFGNTPPYYNAVERMIAGIAEPEILEKTGTYTLEPVHEKGRSYILETGDPGMFFLFECRSDDGWDSHIGGSGLLAYRIQMPEGGHEQWLTYNEVNVDPAAQGVDLLEADGRTDRFAVSEDFALARQNISGIFYPYADASSIHPDDKRSLTSIRREGDAVKFNFLGNDDSRLPPVAVNITKEAFADAAIISFESSYPFEGEAAVAWGRSGQEKETFKVSPYSPGKYAFVLEKLQSSGKTYDIEISFTSDGIEGEIRQASIMTKRMPSSEWPYIYLGSMERNADGSFPSGVKCPLRVYCATDAAEIRWSFDGRPVTHDGDGYHVLRESGVLQAEIHWEDGSTDKVMKQITITL